MTRSVEVTQADGVRTRQNASLVLTVPAHKDYVVIIRSAVAQLGACFGYTVEEITDLRLAVNEACGLLVAHRPASGPGSGTSSGSDLGLGLDTTDGDLECRAEVRGDVLRVTVAAPAAGLEAPDADGLGWNILAALVDSLAWARDGVTARVNLEKRRGTRVG